MAYKKDIDDVRESPALDIIHLLDRRGARLTYSDPFVPSLKIDGMAVKAIEPEKADADCAVICTNHSSFDYDPDRRKIPAHRRHEKCFAGAGGERNLSVSMVVGGS